MEMKKMAIEHHLFVTNNSTDIGDCSVTNPGSLQQALSLAKQNRERTIIFLHEGTYHLSETLHFGPEMSNVEFRALKSGAVYFDGGKQITGWKKATLQPDAKEIWIADVSGVLNEEAEFKFLYINGQRKERCRYPAKTPEIAEKSETRLTCTPLEALIQAKGIEDFELVLFYDWLCRRLKVSGIDKEGIDFIPDKTKNGSKVHYYIENLPLEFLNPGQWKLDKKNSKVYYMPEEGETLSNFDAIAACTPTLLEICGDPAKGLYVENLKFNGIGFCHTGDNKRENSNQGECEISSAVNLSGALGCHFENCSFTATSGWGINFKEGTRESSITNSLFDDTGAGGIMASGSTEADSCTFTGNNQFTNNTIRHGGRTWAGAIGILLRHSANNQVSNNEISYYHYTGISSGWAWGYGDNVSRNNVISNNHIHHLGEEKLLADMGGIYTLGVQSGTILHGNTIHDISGELISWGIYLDEGSSNIVVENNLVYNIGSECFHVHYGRNNMVRNNVFAMGRTGICSITRGTMDMKCNFTKGDKAFICENNILISSKAPFYVKYLLDYKIQEDLSCIVAENNILLNTENEYALVAADGFHCIDQTYQKTYAAEDWRNLGFDKNSKIIVLEDQHLSQDLISSHLSEAMKNRYAELLLALKNHS